MIMMIEMITMSKLTSTPSNLNNLQNQPKSNPSRLTLIMKKTWPSYSSKKTNTWMICSMFRVLREIKSAKCRSTWTISSMRTCPCRWTQAIKIATLSSPLEWQAAEKVLFCRHWYMAVTVYTKPQLVRKKSLNQNQASAHSKLAMRRHNLRRLRQVFFMRIRIWEIWHSLICPAFLTHKGD